MKKHLILVLVTAMVLGAGLAALAQQDSSRRQRWQRQREAQREAIETIQKHAAKLQANMEEAAKAMENRPRREDMSEEERNKFRETRRKQREEQQKIVDDLELQVAKLKGSRRLSTEHEEAIGELKAIRDLAAEEKAGKTTERLEKLISKNQTKYEEMLQKLGFEQ